MKKSIIYTLLASGLLSGACSKYLDKDPIGIWTEEQVSTEPTTATLTLAVTNSYVPLSNTLNLFGEWNWNAGLVVRNDFIVEDIASGDANKKWVADGDQAWMDEVASFNFVTENGAFNGLWTYAYEGISRTNMSISQLSDDQIVQQTGINLALRDRLLGESYFLRAFYYFDLVINFGDVPLVLRPLENFNEAYEVARRFPAAEVWAQIQADLSAAADLLPQGRFSDSNEPWRVSEGAVLAMQAKVALFMGQWQEVVSKTDALQALGYYRLNAHYFDSFDISKEFAEQEVIFAFDHRPAQLPRRGNGLTALLGWGFLAPSSNFISSFESGDPRLEYTVDVADQAVYKLLGSTNTSDKGNDDAPANRIFIRYADVLLWKAEAYNQLGNQQNAVTLLNEIRRRARNTPLLSGNQAAASVLPDHPVSTDQDQVSAWLMQERRVELGMESHRFSDLRRWGNAQEVLRTMGKNFRPQHYLYPIPQGEVDRSANAIVQNPGY